MAVLGATDLTGCNSIPDFIAGGSLVTFQQTSAPTSWTKQTTHNNKALRVVSGSASSGGSTAFTTVFASRTPAGSVSMSNAAFTLASNAIPSHNHNVSNTVYRDDGSGTLVNTGGSARFFTTTNFDGAGPSAVTSTGGGASHTHSNTASFTGTALDFEVQYVDLIICSKN